jgi:tetratricopeptide (TPR) repeat protein
MESKLISANLKTLSDKNVVEKIETDKRNHLYRISERFFNMWLIITQGNPDQKRKARWVSVFLENWYDANELQDLAHQHIDNLKANKFNFLLSKGLCQSKYITTFDRDEIIELNEANEGKYLVELPKTVTKIIEEIENYFAVGDFKNALELASSIENEEDGFKYGIMGSIYFKQKLYVESEKYYLLATKKNIEGSYNNLALLYSEQKRYNEAEKYYLLAIEKKEDIALFNLALTYQEQKKYDDAEKYYLLAIEKGNKNAPMNLAILYMNQYNNLENAEKYFLLAIEKGHNNALFNLSLIYYLLNKHKEKAKQYISQYKGNDIHSIIIEIWTGIFNNVENRVITAFRENIDDESLFIESLLYHHQKSLVEKLFNHPEFGQKLQEQYTVLYYASQILNNREDDNLRLKIPPELKATVKDVLKEINILQEFYR